MSNDADRYRFLKEMMEFRCGHYDGPEEPSIWKLITPSMYAKEGQQEPGSLDAALDKLIEEHHMVPVVNEVDIVSPKCTAGEAGTEHDIPACVLPYLLVMRWVQPLDKTEELYQKLAPITPTQYEVMRNLYATVRAFRKEGLMYFLDGGTLLGACRDGRVIEWDKDSDIGVFADENGNYDKYLDCLNEHLPKEFKMIKTRDRWAVCRSEAIKFYHGCELWDWTRTDKGWENHMQTSIRVGNSPVPHEHLDELDNLTLHGLKFFVPKNPRKFIESDFRYGPGAITSPRFREQAGRNARDTRGEDPRNEPMVMEDGKWVRQSESKQHSSNNPS